MATRSTISIKTAKGGETIYSHWDGYPSNNGKLLMEHYNTEAKVKALMKIGDISSLHPSCEKPKGHTFESPVAGHCVAYGRDRGEKGTKATKFKTLPTRKEEWNYLFENGKWKVADGDGDFEPLTDKIIRTDSTDETAE